MPHVWHRAVDCSHASMQCCNQCRGLLCSNLFTGGLRLCYIPSSTSNPLLTAAGLSQVCFVSQVRYRWAWCKHLPIPVWGPADRPDWKSKPVPKLLGGAHWAAPEFDSDDVGTEPLLLSAKEQAGHTSLPDSEAHDSSYTEGAGVVNMLS